MQITKQSLLMSDLRILMPVVVVKRLHRDMRDKNKNKVRDLVMRDANRKATSIVRASFYVLDFNQRSHGTQTV